LIELSHVIDLAGVKLDDLYETHRCHPPRQNVERIMPRRGPTSPVRIGSSGAAAPRAAFAPALIMRLWRRTASAAAR